MYQGESLHIIWNVLGRTYRVTQTWNLRFRLHVEDDTHRASMSISTTAFRSISADKHGRTAKRLRLEISRCLKVAVGRHVGE